MEWNDLREGVLCIHELLWGYMGRDVGEESGWNGLLWGGTRIGLNPNMIVCLHLLQNKR